MTAHDNCHQTSNSNGYARLNAVTCNLSDEESIRSGFEQANERFGPVNILIVNAGMKDECNHYPIWDIPLDIWEENYRVNVRGAFLTIKHFLLSARAAQQSLGRDLENLSIVVVGSRQEGHADYGSAAAVLHYGLVTGVKDEIARLNYNARINTVAPGRADMHTTGWLHDSKETEAQTTYSKPEDVARSITFLASHRAAGHISGQILSVHGCRESYLVWKENGPFRTAAVAPDTQANEVVAQSIPESISKPKRNKIRIAVSVDLDVVSGWLGTGKFVRSYRGQEANHFKKVSTRTIYWRTTLQASLQPKWTCLGYCACLKNSILRTVVRGSFPAIQPKVFQRKFATLSTPAVRTACMAMHIRAHTNSQSSRSEMC